MNNRYIVTKCSNDGTFKAGDHIIKYSNGDIGCVEAKGWIPEDETVSATNGMEIKPDADYVNRKIDTDYIARALRYCDPFGFSYIVGVYSTEEKAQKSADAEANLRGGKYTCRVEEFTIDKYAA